MLKQETKTGYSLALLDIAKEEKKIDVFYEQSLVLLDVLDNNESLELILDQIGVELDEKEKMVKNIFKDIHWSLVNVMLMLSSKNQFKGFKDILKELIKYLQDILKIKQGIVYSTKALTKTEIKKLEIKVSKQFDSKVILKNYIDKELIGGFRIVVDSVVIEDSVKSELNNIKQTLKLKRGGI